MAGILVSLVLVLLFFTSASQSVSAQATLPPDNPPVGEMFRLERVPVEGGAELLTIEARLDGLETTAKPTWVPLVTVLRDTLGDLSAENDRLRYVWPLTYTRPTIRQRVSGAVPFLYSRVGSKRNNSAKAPPPALDLAATDHDVWNRIFWSALQTVLLDPYGVPVKASTRSYRTNITDYRESHIIRALSVLSLYQGVEEQRTFSESEFSEIQARLRLTDKTFGGLVGDLKLERYNDQQLIAARDTRGHNWELLRQRAEAESLFFEPLKMPDGSATHGLIWVTKTDLKQNQGRRYDKRFLNFANPWNDKRLLGWEGYTETRFLDADNRPVSSDTPGARALEFIPLALFGLDNPKIPMLLVDFRDGFNPKKREMSRRALQDVTKNILSVSKFGNLPYFLGRTVLDFVTGRRGIDLNQPTRLQTYSQLKLLLSLNQSLKPDLREQIENRLERVSLNPLENDLDAETKLATTQYASLLHYAKRPDGLPKKLDRDRREEMVALEHGRTERVLFRLANLLSFGKYTHREKANPEMEARLDNARRLAFHTRFLREVARTGAQVEVVWNQDDVKRSLQFISDHGQAANSQSASAAAKIFKLTTDDETRRYCLLSLTRMTTSRAKSELLRLSQAKDLDQPGKDLLISYLSASGQPVEPATDTSEKSSSSRVDQ